MQGTFKRITGNSIAVPLCRLTAIFLPINNIVYDFTLFRGGLAEVNAGGLNALMPHKIGKKRYIITL